MSANLVEDPLISSENEEDRTTYASNFGRVYPYQFEPRAKDNTSVERRPELSPASADRVGNATW